MRPKQNGRHFTDNIFKCIFLNEYIYINFAKYFTEVVPNTQINNIPALVQISFNELKHISETDMYLDYFLWNCPQVNATGPDF